jgi:hypothetical protein
VTASISFRQRPATVHRATCYRVAVDYTARRGRTAGVAEQLSNAERGLPERVAAVLCWLEARFFSCLHQLTCNTTQRYLQPPFVVPMCVSGCTVHNNLVLVLRLYGVHTTCECSGAVEHGHNGGLCIVLTCSWRVANFGSPTFGTRTRARRLWTTIVKGHTERTPIYMIYDTMRTCPRYIVEFSGKVRSVQ